MRDFWLIPYIVDADPVLATNLNISSEFFFNTTSIVHVQALVCCSSPHRLAGTNTIENRRKKAVIKNKNRNTVQNYMWTW